MLATIFTVWLLIMANAQEIQQKLQDLIDEFASSLPDKLAEIDNLWKLVVSTQKIITLNDLIFTSHKLAGAGSSFGFNGITEHARALENALKIILENSDEDHIVWNQEQTSSIALLVKKLLDNNNLKPSNKIEQPVKNIIRADSDKLIIYIQEKNRLVRNELQSKLETYNYSVRNFLTLGDLKQAIIETPPHVLIMDATLFNAATREMIADFKQQGYAFSIIHLADDDDFTHRLNAVRIGADFYMTRPVDASLVIDTIDKISVADTPEPSRVLIVDDALSTSQFYALSLNNAGIQTRIVTDPFNVMQEVIDFKPELILLDLYMPECNGLELARVIRQQPNYIGTPILFLSAETDIKKQLETLEMGADEFLTKPVNTNHLIAVVKSKLERYRQLTLLMNNDSLTGLLNHTNVVSALETEIARARRDSTNLSYAMIDLDHFKAINDNYGHYTGDVVIKSIARFLKKRLRITDIIGRYGGEEFVALLPGIDASVAKNVLQEILDDFYKISFTHINHKFNVSFSCGIADVVSFPTAEAISEAADNALYAAKQAGRHCIRIAEN